MNTRHNRQSGFTLVEMIMVIVITGIIGGMVAVFLQVPVHQYTDVARRAELTDIADTAILRMARDVRIAVPNSVRLTGACPSCAVEFLPTRDGGRYRAAQDCSGACTGDVLGFGVADGSFDIIGTANFAANDYIVVGSTQSDGNPPYDQTSSGILRPYTGPAGTAITNVTFINPAPGLPTWAALPSQRFDVVDGSQQAVTYACENATGVDANGNGTGKLMRYWHYGFKQTQVNPPVGGGMQSAILASKVSNCTIDYSVANQRFGLLAIRLTLTSGGETVSLYNEIHVNNSP
ncbi:MAG TPA: type II secretion system protein [Gallionella sp.]|nr:type II secretion system protein [Gallionella sp.]